MLLKKLWSVFYTYFLKPRSKGEDNQRRELILNIVLLVLAGLLVCLNGLLVFHSTTEGSEYRGLPILTFAVLSSPILLLYILSRIGFFILSSYLLVFLFLMGSAWGSYQWGLDLPTSLLSYALLITLASVLISTKTSIIITVFLAVFMLVLGHTQSTGTVLPNTHWKTTVSQPGDALEYVLFLVIILGISSLSSREIEKSLQRARKSELELTKERDLLEIKVKERTSQLEKAQLEKISQLKKFTEFGKLASGIFHDLANPLTALSVSIGQLKNKNSAESIQESVNQAFAASKKMENFLQIGKKHLQFNEEIKNFSLDNEIEDILELLAHKAKKSNVILLFKPNGKVSITGNPTKFYQAILNLVDNAIDSTLENNNKQKVVSISMEENESKISIFIIDNGVGIEEKNIKKIFEPFYTTKAKNGSLGIGLSTTKEIITTTFNGSINVESNSNGTTVTLSIPK